MINLKIRLVYIFKYIRHYIRIKFGLNLIRKSPFKEHHQKTLFIHIPKSAGMSVVHALYGIEKSNHATAHDFKVQDEERFNQLTVFSVCRNPYTRLYSAYMYLKKGGMNINDKVWYDLYLKGYESFDDFVLNGGMEYAIKMKADHFRPQTEYIYYGTEKLVDKIFKIEEPIVLNEFVSKQLGTEINLKKVNKTKKKAISLSSDVEQKIYSSYINDFKALGYHRGKY